MGPAKPSKYIRTVVDILTEFPDKPIVIWSRVSTKSQRKNLADQTRTLLDYLKSLGVEKNVIQTFERIESSRMCDDRIWFEACIEFAREHDAVIVAESRCRLLRSNRYNGCNDSDLISDDEFSQFSNLLSGVPVATRLDPGLASARPFQTRRGIVAKNAKQGRPGVKQPGYKKRRRTENLERALQLSAIEGLSVRAIARLLTVPSSTVHRWITLM